MNKQQEILDNGVLVSVVIVNYNGARFIRDCLESVAKHVELPHEVIVVDNASGDESCEIVSEEFPEVRLIALEDNYGFSCGNNIGARAASGRYLLLLNVDTVLESSIAPAIEMLESDEKIGVLGSRLSYADGSLQPSIGYEHTALRLTLSWLGLGRFKSAPRIFKRFEPSPAYYDKVRRDLDWVSGAFLITPLSLWGRLNGLDEAYFMYIEDVDYCKRAREAGFEVCYTPSVRVTHYEGSDRPWIGEGALYSTMDSYLHYSGKFHGHAAKDVLRYSLGVVMLLRSAAFALSSWLTRSKVHSDKATAFFKVSRALIGGGR